MSELAPMDILGQKFSKRLQGYSQIEVHEYLTELARVIEGLLRERGELRQRVHHMEQELKAFHERETALKEALVAAQRSAETTIEVARVEGQRIVDREVRAELNRIVELVEGLVQDDKRREQEERATPQLASFQRHTRESTENQG